MYQSLINAKSELRVEYLNILDYVKGEEVPVTVSKHYLSLKKLEREGQYNEVYVANIGKLAKKFVAWKRTRGDGNCYYRSVMASFLTKLFHYSSPVVHLEIFIAKLNWILENVDYSHFHRIIQELLLVFNKILNESHDFDKRIEAFIEIQRLIQDEEFDRKVIVLARVISKIELLRKMNDEDFKGFYTEDDIELLKNNVEEMGREAEGIELILLPSGLDIEVTQINLFNDVVENFYPMQDETGEKLKVSIISKGRGHYDCLYSKQELEKECYCLMKKQYFVVRR